MIKKSHFILYVEDQSISTEFYSKLLDSEPVLNVPGMTEFSLSKDSVLGIMPKKGIEKLLENKINVVPNFDKKVKAELYLIVDSIETYLNRAESLESQILSETKIRDWGDKAVYLLDPDQHVIAFAEKI